MVMIHQRHRQTDRRTDGQTTSDSKTALCTVVHRAVKVKATPLAICEPLLMLHWEKCVPCSRQWWCKISDRI